MTENGLFVLGGPETQPQDILWVFHDGKNVVEARARKILGSSWLWWVVRAKQCTEVCTFLSYTYARVCEALGSN